MKASKLLAINGIDPEIQAHYRFISSAKNTTPEHCHDFFELFLILKGSVLHCINGRKELLEENTLVFIRDRDIHYYEQATENDCQFINLSFYKEVIDSLFNFLGEGFPQSSLLSPEMPPVVLLSTLEKEYVQHRLERLNMIASTKKSLIKAEVRALLIELFSRYIMESYPIFTLEQPEWLHDVCRAMKEKDNFVEGIPALLRISQKTHAHLCRVFKKHLATTPIDYINSLRMSYAENLLLNTDMDILNICLETGFENISYFYELFKRYFKMTPHKFRKSKKQHL